MRIHLIHVPYDSAHRAARMGGGPVHLAQHGVAARLRADGHDVEEMWIEAPPVLPPEIATAFELSRRLAVAVERARGDGARPIVLAGNCSTALGTVSGLGPENLGVVWFDAHADLNTPDTSVSGFFDGMALSLVMGRSWRELVRSVPGSRPIPGTRVAMVGVRDLDLAEEEFVEASTVARVLVADVRELGAVPAMARALEPMGHEVSRVYVHIDLDVHDPAEARANHFAAPGGLSRAEVREAVAAIAQRFTIAGAAITAYDPSFDAEGRTLEAAIELIRLLAE